MTLPPYATALGIEVAPGEGPPVLLMPFADAVLGRPGFLHGGAIAGLLEVAALAALRHALGEDEVAVELVTSTVDFRRGGRDRPTRAAATVTRLGTRVAHLDATAWQDDPAQPIATARLTYQLKRLTSPA